MSNLIIGSACNLHCPFCFASEFCRDATDNKDWMPVAEFVRLLEFASGSQVRFCGGEPTLHPEFSEMLEIALARRDRTSVIMTNGLWPDSVLEHVEAMSLEKQTATKLLVNVLEPSLYSPSQYERLRTTLAVLNPRQVTLGITLYRHPFDFGYVIDLARDYGIGQIRYSVAAPNVSDSNSWLLDPVRDFKPLAKVVARLARNTAAAGISLIADCGYLPPCSFEPEDLAAVVLAARGSHPIRFGCTSSTDISSGGQSWRCYGVFSVLRANALGFADGSELTKHFDRRTRLLDDIKLFAECADCRHEMSHACGGGCYAYRLRTLLTQYPAACLAPIDNDEELLKTTPIQNSPVIQIWERRGKPIEILLHKEGGAFSLDATDNVIDFLRACDGKTTVGSMVERWASNFDSVDEARAEVLAMTRQLFEEDAIQLKQNRPPLVLPSMDAAPDNSAQTLNIRFR